VLRCQISKDAVSPALALGLHCLMATSYEAGRFASAAPFNPHFPDMALTPFENDVGSVGRGATVLVPSRDPMPVIGGSLICRSRRIALSCDDWPERSGSAPDDAVSGHS
jgi:hypothetical protein